MMHSVLANGLDIRPIAQRSPFRRYNLRRNPFGELTQQERAELAVVDPTDWLDFLQDDLAVLQFIGPCGRGKTTHLLAILRAIPRAQYVYLPEDGPQPAISRHRPLLIDESQRLSFLQLRRVFHVRGALVLGTHRDHTRAIQRAGREVVTVDVAAHHSPHRLAAILNRRLEASRVTEGEIPHVSLQHAVKLCDKFGTDIRAMEHFLYDQFQACVNEQTPWPPAP
jgi:hypothetical protein